MVPQGLLSNRNFKNWNLIGCFPTYDHRLFDCWNAHCLLPQLGYIISPLFSSVLLFEAFLLVIIADSVRACDINQLCVCARARAHMGFYLFIYFKQKRNRLEGYHIFHGIDGLDSENVL